MQIARLRLLQVFWVAVVLSAPALDAQSKSGVLAKGREILETNCSRCHAIGRAGASPNVLAPPFRNVVAKYVPEALRGALTMGLASNHPDMPVFMLDRDDVSAILAYFGSLSAEAGH